MTIELKRGAVFRRLIDQVESVHRVSFALRAASFLIILGCISPPPAHGAAPKDFEFSGKAILTVGSGMHIRPCREIFLILPADAASLGLGGDDHLKMDWEFYDRVRVARSHARAVTTCDSNGSFRFHDIPGGKMFAVARFSWLRGKWSTGGSLIGEVDLPSDQPLELRAHLVQ
jgi:hypothetical protein